MGRKRKNNALVSYVDDSTVIVRDFRRRPPFESYESCENGRYYKLDEKWLYPAMDKRQDQLRPGADEGNQNMQRNWLLSIGLQAMVHLKLQQIKKRNTIHRLTSRWKVDLHDMEKMLELEQENLQKLEEEHRKTCEAIEKLKSMSKKKEEKNHEA